MRVASSNLVSCSTKTQALSPIYGEGEHSEAFKAKLGESVLFPHRLGKAEELASMVIELITNSYMNAEVVRVDGGIRMPPK